MMCARAYNESMATVIIRKNEQMIDMMEMEGNTVAKGKGRGTEVR